MKNYKLPLALAGVFAIAGSLAHGATITWASTTTGDDGDWAVGANWTGGEVPGASDRADWNSGITVTSSTNVTVAGIRHGNSGVAASRGGLIIDGGTFNSTAEFGIGWNNAGDYTIAGPNTTLNITGDMTVRGNDVATGWNTVINVENGATVNVSNRLRARDGVDRLYQHTLNISGGSTFFHGGDFLSAGGRAWGHAYNIEGNNLVISIADLGSTFTLSGNHVSLLESMMGSNNLVVSGVHSLSFDGDSGFTTLAIIPEPSALAFLGIGLGLMLRRGRRLA
jgi:hypothetical protein